MSLALACRHKNDMRHDVAVTFMSRATRTCPEASLWCSLRGFFSGGCGASAIASTIDAVEAVTGLAVSLSFAKPARTRRLQPTRKVLASSAAHKGGGARQAFAARLARTGPVTASVGRRRSPAPALSAKGSLRGEPRAHPVGGSQSTHEHTAVKGQDGPHAPARRAHHPAQR